MIEPTVTIALAELVRLQGYERRARECLAMLTADLNQTDEQRAEIRARIKVTWPEYESPSAEEDAIAKRLTDYAGQFVAHVLEGP